MEQEELCNIITDSSGNYVVQEVFKICTAEERIQIMEKIEEKLIDLSCHKKGTHSIQTLVVELKSPDEIKRFLDIIKGKELILSSNSYGTFVLQKVVDHFPEDLLVQIHDICRDNFIEMATSNNGLPIIKKALAKFKRSKHSFVDIIEEHTNSLAQHHFGNYAIQVAIENWDQEDWKKIFEIVLNNLQQLSMQKISSNVVEKCIDKASQDTIKEFMNVINNKEFIKMLIRNMYAFFVVERALMRSTDHEVKVQIAHEILSNIK